MNWPVFGLDRFPKVVSGTCAEAGRALRARQAEHGVPDLPFRKFLSRIALASALMVLATGCAFSGGLTPVGGQQVVGTYQCVGGPGNGNQTLVLMQGHFNHLNAETVNWVTTPTDEYQLEHAELTTDPDGNFAHKLRGFTHCHPRWVIPPLWSLPSHLTGEADHGKFFILQTPEPGGQVYEIRLSDHRAKIKVFDEGRKRLRRIDPAKDGEHVSADVRYIDFDFGNGYSRLIQEVALVITREALSDEAKVFPH